MDIPTPSASVVTVQSAGSGISGVIRLGNVFYEFTGEASITPMDREATLQATTSIQRSAMQRFREVVVAEGTSTKESAIRQFLIEATMDQLRQQRKLQLWQMIMSRFNLSDADRDNAEYFARLKDFEECWRDIEAVLDNPQEYLELHRHPAITSS